MVQLLPSLFLILSCPQWVFHLCISHFVTHDDEEMLNFVKLFNKEVRSSHHGYDYNFFCFFPDRHTSIKMLSPWSALWLLVVPLQSWSWSLPRVPASGEAIGGLTPMFCWGWLTLCKTIFFYRFVPHAYHHSSFIIFGLATWLYAMLFHAKFAPAMVMWLYRRHIHEENILLIIITCNDKCNEMVAMLIVMNPLIMFVFFIWK